MRIVLDTVFFVVDMIFTLIVLATVVAFWCERSRRWD